MRKPPGIKADGFQNKHGFRTFPLALSTVFVHNNLTEAIPLRHGNGGYHERKAHLPNPDRQVAINHHH
jgi:hypothetical protein